MPAVHAPGRVPVDVHIPDTAQRAPAWTVASATKLVVSGGPLPCPTNHGKCMVG